MPGRTRLVACALVACTTLLVAAAAHAAGTAAPLRMGLAAEARTLDPRFATDATSSRINRLLYARLGTPGCPQCGKPVRAQTPERIVERILQDCAGERASNGAQSIDRFARLRR